MTSQGAPRAALPPLTASTDPATPTLGGVHANAVPPVSAPSLSSVTWGTAQIYDLPLASDPDGPYNPAHWGYQDCY